MGRIKAEGSGAFLFNRPLAIDGLCYFVDNPILTVDDARNRKAASGGNMLSRDTMCWEDLAQTTGEVVVILEGEMEYKVAAAAVHSGWNIGTATARRLYGHGGGR